MICKITRRKQMTEDIITFSFGKNWENFVRVNFSEDRVKISRKHLLNFLELDNLNGKYFLDIGCGSGIHSLAAFKSGAQKIISFDVDPHSVATTKKIREMYGNPSNWEVSHGSILDTTVVSKIEPADIVYSWGVLHHTGNLWLAVRNAASVVKEGGLFYIALYEKTAQSGYWIKIKKKYNCSSPLMKRIMELGYVWAVFFRTLSISKIKSSIQYIKDYEKNRGMEFWTDIKDWLGGWPYEPATEEEVCRFCENELNLIKIKVKTGEANIEYLFSKKKAIGS
jgi:SAM-dependent methyltransferase